MSRYLCFVSGDSFRNTLIIFPVIATKVDILSSHFRPSRFRHYLPRYFICLPTPQIYVSSVSGDSKWQHCALRMTKDAYDEVGENLLGTIDKLLNKYPTVLEAWSDLYIGIDAAFVARKFNHRRGRECAGKLGRTTDLCSDQ